METIKIVTAPDGDESKIYLIEHSSCSDHLIYNNYYNDKLTDNQKKQNYSFYYKNSNDKIVEDVDLEDERYVNIKLANSNTFQIIPKAWISDERIDAFKLLIRKINSVGKGTIKLSYPKPFIFNLKDNLYFTKEYEYCDPYNKKLSKLMAKDTFQTAKNLVNSYGTEYWRIDIEGTLKQDELKYKKLFLFTIFRSFYYFRGKKTFYSDLIIEFIKNGFNIIQAATFATLYIYFKGSSAEETMGMNGRTFPLEINRYVNIDKFKKNKSLIGSYLATYFDYGNNQQANKEYKGVLMKIEDYLKYPPLSGMMLSKDKDVKKAVLAKDFEKLKEICDKYDKIDHDEKR